MKKKKYLIYLCIALVLILIIGVFQLQGVTEEKEPAQPLKTKAAATSKEEIADIPNKKDKVDNSITKVKSENKSIKQPDDKPKEKQINKETKQQIEISKDLANARKSKGTIIATGGTTTKQSDYYNRANVLEGTLKKDETVKIIGEQANWYVIRYKEDLFYILKESVKPLGLRAVKAKYENINVFSEPDKRSKLLGDVKKGKTLGVVGIHNTFYKVIYGEGYGYIERSKSMLEKN